jgi:hypothetical protein
MYTLGALILTLFVVDARLPGKARTRDLTEEEARELVIAALDPEALKLPKLSLDIDNDPNAPDFYKFDVTFSNADPRGSPVVGFLRSTESRETYGDWWSASG